MAIAQLNKCKWQENYTDHVIVGNCLKCSNNGGIEHQLCKDVSPYMNHHQYKKKTSQKNFNIA
jgi:hypothetical protein